MHAPYGRAALEALASAGLEDLSPERVARGESVVQALQYPLAGAVDAALVPRSLAAGVPAGTDVVVGAIDPARHAPIERALGLVGGAGSGCAGDRAVLRALHGAGRARGRELLGTARRGVHGRRVCEGVLRLALTGPARGAPLRA